MNEKTIVDVSTSMTASNNSEHTMLHENFLAEISEDTMLKYNINDYYSNYKSAVLSQLGINQPTPAFEDSEDLKNADEQRGNGFYLLSNLIDAYARYCLNKELREAGERLNYLIAPVTGVTRRPYSEQTSVLSDLYRTFLEDKYRGDIEKLHLTHFVELANSANENFNQLYITRSKEVMNRVVNATVTESRPRTDETYYTLINAINSIYIVNQIQEQNEETEAEIGGLIDKLNALLIQFDRTVRIRLGMSLSDYEELESTTEDNPTEEEETPDIEEEEPGIPHP